MTGWLGSRRFAFWEVDGTIWKLGMRRPSSQLGMAMVWYGSRSSDGDFFYLSVLRIITSLLKAIYLLPSSWSSWQPVALTSLFLEAMRRVGLAGGY